MTQEFFTRALETGFLSKVQRERGSFRAILKTALSHFAINQFH
jgi:hypothetical protein